MIPHPIMPLVIRAGHAFDGGRYDAQRFYNLLFSAAFRIVHAPAFSASFHTLLH